MTRLFKGFKRRPKYVRLQSDFEKQATADFLSGEGLRDRDDVVFLFSVVSFPENDRVRYLVRKREVSNLVRYIFWSKISDSENFSCRRMFCARRYKSFLDDIAEVTKDWKSYYDGYSGSGYRATIYCPDVGLNTDINNLTPDNFSSFMDVLKKYF